MTETILNANALNIPIPDESVDMCVTSPPYWGLRDYGVSDQLGLEATPEEYIENMVTVFREVKRVLKDEGTLWLNIGDSYYNYRPGGTSQPKQTLAKHDGAVVTQTSKRNAKFEGVKEKDLVGIPWMLAFALRADGWYLRSDIIWHKPNPMPESVRDRPTKSHEYLFLLSKNKKYYYDADAIKEPAIHAGQVVTLGEKSLSKGQANGANVNKSGNALKDSVTVASGRNKRSVWTVATRPYSGAHFATFPPDLIEPCIKAGSPKGGTVLDPFMGSGTTLLVSRQLGRNSIGVELNPEYIGLAKERLELNDGLGEGAKKVESNWEDMPLFGGVENNKSHRKNSNTPRPNSQPHSMHLARDNEDL